jgi:hypothetical protein
VTSNTAALLATIVVISGQQAIYVPGRVISRLTVVFSGGAKSAAKDVRVIAETARRRTDLAVVPVTDEVVVEQRTMTTHPEDVMSAWVRGGNWLGDLLTGEFPAQERAFDCSARSPLVLPTRFQTPDAIRAAG